MAVGLREDVGVGALHEKQGESGQQGRGGRSGCQEPEEDSGWISIQNCEETACDFSLARAECDEIRPAKLEIKKCSSKSTDKFSGIHVVKHNAVPNFDAFFRMSHFCRKWCICMEAS